MTGPDRKAVARAFRRAAPGYEAADFLHAEIRARLLERLDLVRLDADVVIDLGAGPPSATADVARRFPGATVLAVDLVPEMLGCDARPWRRLCADAARLPLPDQSADLVVAGMMLHWCEDPAAVLAEARRVLRTPGLLLLTTLGPDSLRELRAAWLAADHGDHTLRFTDMHDLGDGLLAAGLAEPVVDVETLAVAYRDPRRLVADLRGVGAADLSPSRRRTLTGRRRWAAMTDALRAGRGPDGSFQITLEVVYGHAWSGAAGRDRPAGGREVSISLEQLRRRS